MGRLICGFVKGTDGRSHETYDQWRGLGIQWLIYPSFYEMNIRTGFSVGMKIIQLKMVVKVWNYNLARKNAGLDGKRKITSSKKKKSTPRKKARKKR